MYSSTPKKEPKSALSTEIQCKVDSQMDVNVVIIKKYKQLSASIEPSNYGFDPSLLDPVVKIPFQELYNSLHFCTDQQKILFISAFINWNQCLMEVYSLRRQNNQLQQFGNPPIKNLEMTVSKFHQIDFSEEVQQESVIQLSKSFFEESNLFKSLQPLQNLTIERSTQTDYNSQDATTECDYPNDEILINDYFNSELYKDLKNQNFLVNAQLMSIIQTICIHNSNYTQSLFAINRIKEELHLIWGQLKEQDTVSLRTYEILVKMIQ